MASATELQALTRKALEGSYTNEDIVSDYVGWFKKRGERFLTTAAKMGYTEATLDLPYQLAQKIDKPAYKKLVTEIRELVPGCVVDIVEEEYNGATLYKMEISWKGIAASPFFGEAPSGIAVEFAAAGTKRAAEATEATEAPPAPPTCDPVPRSLTPQ